MAELPDLMLDPTLAAVDRAMEAGQDRSPRAYLGMSAIGGDCSRRLWYMFRWALRPFFSADALKRFADGHHGEDVQAARLRMVDGIELHTHDEDGRQFGFVDISGHFQGHMDGAIRGILQAPKTWHIWEHKQVDGKKQAALEKIKRELGEKKALKEWDPVYYGQGQLYMHYAGLTRHYLTCSTPGGRHTVSVRTDYHAPTALRLIEKARRIIEAQEPPPKWSEDPDHFGCRWCDFKPICHGGELPEVNCRTCAHSTPDTTREGGRWTCALHKTDILPLKQRDGCPDHLFIPALTHRRATDASVNENWIEYEDGTRNGGGGVSSVDWREAVNEQT